MPAVSKAQQRLMGAAEHNPSAFPMTEKVADSMSHGQMHDFASGSMQGKPEHKKHKKKEHKVGRQAKGRGGNPY